MADNILLGIIIIGMAVTMFFYKAFRTTESYMIPFGATFVVAIIYVMLFKHKK